MTRKIATILATMLLGCAAASAQDYYSEFTDSLYYNYMQSEPTFMESMPSALKGDLGTVTVHQSHLLSEALEQHIEANALRPVVGYRVRIFFSNAQNARTASIAAAERFSLAFPDCPVYRSYVNPNFKVTVGDFHSKSEALRLLSMMRKDFPAAFVVKENLN